MVEELPKNVIEVDPEVAEAIKKLAVSTGKSPKDIVSKLFTLQMGEKEETPRDRMKALLSNITEPKGREKENSIFDKMMEMQALSKFTDNKDSLFDKDFLKMMWQMQMMSQLMPNMQPQQQGSSLKETIELAKLISGGDGGDKKEMLGLIKEIESQKNEQIAEMRKEQMQQIKDLLQEKRLTEMEKKQEAQLKAIEGKVGMFSEDMIDKLNSVETAIANRPRGESISEEIKKYLEFKETMLQLAKAEGLTKKEITDSSGKIDWAKLGDKLIDTVGQVGSALAQRQPQPQQVKPMAVPEVAEGEIQEVREPLPQESSAIGLPGQKPKKRKEREVPQEVLGVGTPGIGDEVEVLTPEELEEMKGIQESVPAQEEEIIEEAPKVEVDKEILPKGYYRDARGMLRQPGRVGVISRKEEAAILHSLHKKAERGQ